MTDLREYVRNTINESLADYNGDIDAVLHDATQGTNTGWWGDLIYYSDMVPMALEYRRDIAAALADYKDATGDEYKKVEHGGQVSATSYDILSALMLSADEIFADDEALSNATLGLQFTVEWLAHDIACQLSDSF